MVVLRYDEVDSTQNVARERARAGALHGTVVIAERQTAGRGRLGRTWASEAGQNLTFSVVLRPRGPARDAPLLTLGAAAALAARFDVLVKWPNDVVDGAGRKIAGLLGELETDGDRVRWVVLGVGLNVNQTRFPDLPNAASLAMVRGRPLERESVLGAAVHAIVGGAEDPGRLDVWRARAHTLGRHVRVGGVEGVAEALRDDGALIVGGVPVTTGEIGMEGG